MKRFYFVYVCSIILVIIFSYGCWRIGRIINYNLSYKDMVIKTIQENVKQEALK